jgi:hypothetical protein
MKIELIFSEIEYGTDMGLKIEILLSGLTLNKGETAFSAIFVNRQLPLLCIA